jgi:hypothetical protein
MFPILRSWRSGKLTCFSDLNLYIYIKKKAKTLGEKEASLELYAGADIYGG